MSTETIYTLIFVIGLIAGVMIIFFISEYTYKKMIRDDIARINSIYQKVAGRNATVNEIYDNAIYPIEEYEKELVK